MDVAAQLKLREMEIRRLRAQFVQGSQFSLPDEDQTIFYQILEDETGLTPESFHKKFFIRVGASFDRTIGTSLNKDPSILVERKGDKKIESSDSSEIIPGYYSLIGGTIEDPLITIPFAAFRLAYWEKSNRDLLHNGLFNTIHRYDGALARIIDESCDLKKNVYVNQLLNLAKLMDNPVGLEPQDYGFEGSLDGKVDTYHTVRMELYREFEEETGLRKKPKSERRLTGTPYINGAKYLPTYIELLNPNIEDSPAEYFVMPMYYLDIRGNPQEITDTIKPKIGKASEVEKIRWESTNQIANSHHYIRHNIRHSVYSFVRFAEAYCELSTQRGHA